ncbi:uncharacterized protein SEPMUDRAFT_148018 [Sphaerulina musiva SO2202]|uniref:Uncharacterized protein n=1 Tax=Sphaerulina musiva (strain SO2202) TaxID=692275 RepID=M3D7T8_SPHMS|nr:uncharacterized protein SEPMUDRAFT_148018 [Sphaerulina musiva SO2202]EMF14245.1 hypothetical protein SEPMUDRAFT_148018 [Sphaerulina musiva SO2202]
MQIQYSVYCQGRVRYCCQGRRGDECIEGCRSECCLGVSDIPKLMPSHGKGGEHSRPRLGCEPRPTTLRRPCVRPSQSRSQDGRHASNDPAFW